MELMSPAGSTQSLIAAIEAGADAIYLGYVKFNARKPADNFDAVKLRKVVQYVHSLGKKIYLTLNIDLKPQEMREALELVQYCASIGVDALIVKDFGLIYLLKEHFYGKIEYHASTQTAISTSKGVTFAGQCGFSRVVLARELSLDEINSIVHMNNIEIEVFVEGSMCFSISGRCLMSSWVGGRSGNRGSCTAPCRLLWKQGETQGTFFSMKDMLLVNHLSALKKAGIHTLKIEGRLKSYTWVHAITQAYRQALNQINIQKTEAELNELHNTLSQYSARETSEGHYFSHKNLVGWNSQWKNFKKGSTISFHKKASDFESSIQLHIYATDNKLSGTITIEEYSQEITFPLPPPPKKGKPVALASIKEIILQETSSNCMVYIENDQILTTSSGIQKIAAEINAEIKQIFKKLNALPSLNEPLLHILNYTLTQTHRPATLGGNPNKFRITYREAKHFAHTKPYPQIKTLVVELSPNLALEMVQKLTEKYEIILSIPEVLYEKQLCTYEQLIHDYKAAQFTDFEANSYTGIELLQNHKVTKHAGPGIAVYNQFSAEHLIALGFQTAYISHELEYETISTLSKLITIPIDIVAFAQLPLFISRVDEPVFVENAQFEDKIGTEVVCRNKDGLNYFLSNRYLNLCTKEVLAKSILIDSISADISFHENPSAIIPQILSRTNSIKNSSTFNFFRKLV